jgi:hypothetical protein
MASSRVSFLATLMRSGDLNHRPPPWSGYAGKICIRMVMRSRSSILQITCRCL